MCHMEALAWIYPASSTVLTAFYLPQILTVVRAKSSLKEVSLWSWGVWSACLIVSFLYSLLVANDNKIAFFNLINSVLCMAVFGITLYKRFYRYKNTCA